MWAFLRVLIALFLVSATTNIVTARGDAVDAAIAADQPAPCDRVGWSLLLEDDEERLNGTLDTVHFGACHNGVAALLLGSCVEPLGQAVLADRVPAGMEYLSCAVNVAATKDHDVVVDPADFFIVDGQDRSYDIEPTYAANIPEDSRLNPTTLGLGQSTYGLIPFLVDAPLAAPFLLAWIPSNDPQQFPVVIVVDRLISVADLAET